MHCLVYFFFIAIPFISCPIAQGQGNASPDSSAYQVAKTYFQHTVGAQSHLYTGEAYTKYEAGIKGDPFFVVTQMQTGDIFYDGSLYTNIPMLYDITRDKLVIDRYDGIQRIQLLTDKIKYFTFEGHRFVNFVTAEGTGDNVSKKLFDVLSTGKVELLARRIKNIKHGLKAEDPYSFVEEDVFYIRNGTSLFMVNNRNDVLEALSDRKTDIKIFTRKNKLRFKKKKESDLLKTITYYESLNK